MCNADLDIALLVPVKVNQLAKGLGFGKQGKVSEQLDEEGQDGTRLKSSPTLSPTSSSSASESSRPGSSN
jgi:hypothetical protein